MADLEELLEKAIAEASPDPDRSGSLEEAFELAIEQMGEELARAKARREELTKEIKK